MPTMSILTWLVLFSTSTNLLAGAKREATVAGADGAEWSRERVAAPSVDETPAELLFTTPGRSSVHWQRSTRSTRRWLPYLLPPAPVTPFRGRLQPTRDDDDDRGASAAENATSAAHATPPSFLHLAPWAPDEYPDPWTGAVECHGSAAPAAGHLQSESLRNASQATALRATGRPLLCDPDRVLDATAWTDVAARLRAFADRFAGANGVAGGEPTGGTAAAARLDYRSSGVEGRADGPYFPSRRLRGGGAPAEGRKVPGAGVGARGAAVVDGVGGLFATNTRRRKRARGTPALAEQRIEVGVALVKKVSETPRRVRSRGLRAGGRMVGTPQRGHLFTVPVSTVSSYHNSTVRCLAWPKLRYSGATPFLIGSPYFSASGLPFKTGTTLGRWHGVCVERIEGEDRSQAKIKARSKCSQMLTGTDCPDPQLAGATSFSRPSFPWSGEEGPETNAPAAAHF